MNDDIVSNEKVMHQLCDAQWRAEQGINTLTPEQQIVAAKVWLCAKAATGDEPYTGGCRTFYSPKEWKERGEEYGLTSTLVIVHDGGDIAPLINADYEYITGYERFQENLNKVFPGCLLEPCTCWYASLHVENSYAQTR